MHLATERYTTTIINPDDFEPSAHWYPKALNATIHPMVNFFLNMEKSRIVERYCHLHPRVKKKALEELLAHKTRFFRWAGADLINVTTEKGRRQMVVIENNSCPSGQKSMPLQDEHKEQGGYRLLIERTFAPIVNSKRNSVEGGLAVIYDKNPMETSGYAAVIADVFDEDVFLVPFYEDDPSPPVRFDEGVMKVRTDDGKWHPIRAAFRYVTQRPWNRIPLHTKTRILNPVLSCLAGGRNKMIAAKAYEIFNSELQRNGLKIVTPETIWDVSKAEIPIWVRKLGGQAVVKVPYSNAGQGVYTIVSQKELEDFMDMEFPYDQFIVQSLIGNYHWSSTGESGKFYHVATIPNAKGQSFVADIRLMVSSTEDGIRPLSVYARRATDPLLDHLEDGCKSWDMLGTNLSYKAPDGNWNTDTNRLMLMDRRDFNKLGLGLDDLIEAYVQTVLSMIVIDNMAQTLTNSKSKFRMRLFKSLNNDPALIHEILQE